MGDHEMKERISESSEGISNNPNHHSQGRATMDGCPVRRRAMALGLVAICIGVGLTATAPTARAESTLERIKDQGYIRMGFANENPF